MFIVGFVSSSFRISDLSLVDTRERGLVYLQPYEPER